MLIFVCSLVLAFSVSFLCSLAEACLLSLTPGQIATIMLRRPRVGAVMQEFKNDIEKPISVILTLNTVAHTVGATVAGAQFAIIYGSAWIGIFSLFFTYIMLQFTEILPKTLGVRFNERLAGPLALSMPALIRLMSPISAMIHLVNRPFEAKGDRPRAAGLDELAALAGLARISNLLNPHQERIIRATALLSKRRIVELMIPVEQITFLSTSMTLADAIVVAHMDPHTRFPINRDGDRDDIVGYINFKELVYRVRTNPSDPTLAGIIRPVHFLTPETPSAEALKIFVNEHVHMAVIRDANIRTLGLVTLEDVIEELVGDLEDEFDRLPRMVHPLSKGVWVMGGGVVMGELATRIGMTCALPSQILSDWMVQKTGSVPQIGQAITECGFDFTVRRMRRGRVFEVLVTPEGKAPPELKPVIHYT
jgi:putative hemolysin